MKCSVQGFVTWRSCGILSRHVELAGEVGNSGPESQAGDVRLCAVPLEGIVVEVITISR